MRSNSGRQEQSTQKTRLVNGSASEVVETSASRRASSTPLRLPSLTQGYSGISAQRILRPGKVITITGNEGED